MAQWRRFVHRHDESVEYEARLSDGLYEFRRLGEKRILGTARKEGWETNYREVKCGKNP